MYSRISKTCNECKSRKVRCVKVPNAERPLCQGCKTRGLDCHFDIKKRRVKRAQPCLAENVPAAVFEIQSSIYDGVALASPGEDMIVRGDRDQRQSGSPTSSSSAHLFIDILLNGTSTLGDQRGSSSVKVQNHHVGSSGISMFSEQRLASISNILGHRRFFDILEKISKAINTKMNRNAGPGSSRISFKPPATPVLVSHESAGRYIHAFMNHLHSVYPFLDRVEFEEKALHEDISQVLLDNPSFSALYHAVLALGCQYHGGGSFEPGVGTAWQLFQVALGLFPDIITPKETLLSVQAVTAMAIFAHNSSCIQLGNMLTGQAGRMAQSIGLNRGVCGNENKEFCYRTFWTIFVLEKTLSFRCDKDSIIMDAVIATPVPRPPEAQIGDFNWFYTMCRFSRLISRVHVTLFSVNASLKSVNSMQADIDIFRRELEAWKASIPEEIRPDSEFSPWTTLNTTSVVKLQIHYHYHSIAIALARVELSLSCSGLSSRPALESELTLLNSACKIIEQAKYIDADTYTPIWVLLSVPISALFLIFDFIVHNPTRPETMHSLPLLGVAVGYFCHLDYASGGALKLSFLADIFQMARSYIEDVRSGLRAEENTANSPDLSQDLPNQPEHLPDGPSVPFENMTSISQILGENQLSETFDETFLSLTDPHTGAVDLMDPFAPILLENFIQL